MRSKFQIEYNLPSEISFKIADSESEIEQALQLVHDSYVELGVIDPTESRFRFSKFHAHPNSVILVIKWNEDVIGTLTVVPDSAVGLPSEATWPMDDFRKQGKLIAEISSMAIKKDFRMRRGQLFSPFCKFMYLICKEYLKLDGVIASTHPEVEPFYTDVLLFEKLGSKAIKSETLVKVASAACCYLALDHKTEEKGRQIYSGKPLHRNLYHFMKEVTTPGMIFLAHHLSIQAYVRDKNAAMAKIIKRTPSLMHGLSDKERLILGNHGLDQVYEQNDLSNLHFLRARTISSRRFEFRGEGSCFVHVNKSPVACKIIDVSKDGLRIQVKGQFPRELGIGDLVNVVFESRGVHIHLKCEILWERHTTVFGCKAFDVPREWLDLIHAMNLENEENRDESVLAADLTPKSGKTA